MKTSVCFSYAKEYCGVLCSVKGTYTTQMTVTLFYIYGRQKEWYTNTPQWVVIVVVVFVVFKHVNIVCVFLCFFLLYKCTDCENMNKVEKQKPSSGVSEFVINIIVNSSQLHGGESSLHFKYFTVAEPTSVNY